MKHSSRRAWSTLNKLTGRKHTSQPATNNTPTANAVAKRLVDNGKFANYDKTFTREVNSQVKRAWNSHSADANLCSDFTHEEMTTALKTLKSGKAPGLDKLHPEFFMNMHSNCINWLLNLMSTCLRLKKIPKVWRRAKVVAILKPNKAVEEPSSYRPISLLCLPYKIMDRMIYNRLEPIIEDVLPNEQAGFRAGRCTLDQVALLTDAIEDAFEKKNKAGAVF